MPIALENQAHARYVVLRIRRRGCLALLALVGVSLLALSMFLLRIDRFLTVDVPPVQAEAIVVLASQPSRIRHAVALFDQGYAPVVVFTDATYNNAGLACSSAPLDVTAAQALGLPSDAVVITQDQVTSTYDEAVAVRQLVQARDWQTLFVVTDPFHTRRAAYTFRTLIPEATTITSATPDPVYDPQHWWRSEEGVMAVFSEIVKLGFYWVAYWRK